MVLLIGMLLLGVVVGWIGTLLAGLVAGWIAVRLMGAGKAGWFAMLLVGVLGSFVGPLVLGLFGFEAVAFPASLIAAVIGAVICIAVVRYLSRRL